MVFKEILRTWERDLQVLILRLQEEINFIGIGEQKRPKKETNQEQINIIWFWDALIFFLISLINL